ncbi:MAG: RidA family protein [Sulfitobacter sp.]
MLDDPTTPEQRLEKLGLKLPPVPSAVGDYEPWVKVGNIIYTSGQLPWIDGDLKFVGKMGAELTTDDGYQAFRLSALNAIAQLKSAVGELSKIKRIIRVEGSANSSPDFTEQPQALNGASHLINEVFGQKGRHTRMIYSDPAMCLDCATLIVLWAEVGT